MFKRVRRWVKADAFYQIFRALAEDADFEHAMIDDSIVKVHRHGQGAKGDSKPGHRTLSRRRDDQDHGFGRRSRQPDRLPPTARAGARPARHSGPLIEGLTRGQFLADRAFDTNWLRDALTEAWIEAVIPQRSNRRFPAGFDRDIYKWRHPIENLFGKLKEYRGIAMRCCKTDESYSAFIAIAATVI